MSRMIRTALIVQNEMRASSRVTTNTAMSQSIGVSKRLSRAGPMPTIVTRKPLGGVLSRPYGLRPARGGVAGRRALRAGAAAGRGRRASGKVHHAGFDRQQNGPAIVYQ